MFHHVFSCFLALISLWIFVLAGPARAGEVRLFHRPNNPDPGFHLVVRERHGNVKIYSCEESVSDLARCRPFGNNMGYSVKDLWRLSERDWFRSIGTSLLEATYPFVSPNERGFLSFLLPADDLTIPDPTNPSTANVPIRLFAQLPVLRDKDIRSRDRIEMSMALHKVLKARTKTVQVDDLTSFAAYLGLALDFLDRQRGGGAPISGCGSR